MSNLLKQKHVLTSLRVKLEAITHQVEANVYYKGYVERMRMDVCDLGKTEVILGMPWLQAHNLEINWETRKVKITRCPPLCGRTRPRGVEKGKRVAILEEEKIVRWAIYHKWPLTNL